MIGNVFWNASDGPLAPRWIQNSWQFPPRGAFMRNVKKRLPLGSRGTESLTWSCASRPVTSPLSESPSTCISAMSSFFHQSASRSPRQVIGRAGGGKKASRMRSAMRAMPLSPGCPATPACQNFPRAWQSLQMPRSQNLTYFKPASAAASRWSCSLAMLGWNKPQTTMSPPFFGANIRFSSSIFAL